MTVSYSTPLWAERSITDPSSLHCLPPAIRQRIIVAMSLLLCYKELLVKYTVLLKPENLKGII